MQEFLLTHIRHLHPELISRYPSSLVTLTFVHVATVCLAGKRTEILSLLRSSTSMLSNALALPWQQLQSFDSDDGRPVHYLHSLVGELDYKYRLAWPLPC